MKKFLSLIALFLLLFWLPVLALEALLRQPGADSYALKHYLAETTAATNEILILGNSLSWTGLNPNLISEHSVNLANFNQTYFNDYKILEKCAAKSPKLTTVILPLSAQSFFALPTERAEQLYSLYWGLPPLSGNVTKEHYSAVLAHGFWAGIEKLWKERQPLEGKGWGAFTKVFDGDEAATQLRLDQLESAMADSNFAICSHFLEKTDSLCKTRGLRLILFYPPFPPSMNKLLAGNHFDEKMKAYVLDFCKKKLLECYDLNDNAAFPIELFRDADHLNLQGAEKLSLLMRGILEKPGAHQDKLCFQTHEN